MGRMPFSCDRSRTPGAASSPPFLERAPEVVYDTVGVVVVERASSGEEGQRRVFKEKMSKKRIPFLDGLRGWGALSVLLGHTFVGVFPVSDASKTVLSKIPLFNGTFAVWIFFVVSGFSLSMHFCESKDVTKLRRMAVGRYFRLAIPVTIVCLLVYVAFAFGLIPGIDEKLPRFKNFYSMTEPSLIQTVRFSMYRAFFSYDSNESLIPPLWTMAYEIWGSFAIFSVLALIGTLEKRFVLYPFLFLIAYTIHPMYSAFLVGLFFAEAYSLGIFSTHRKMLFLLSASLMMPTLYWTTLLPGQDHKVYLAVSSLFVFCVIANDRLTGFFSNKMSRFLGEISFPLYLIHAPVFAALSLHLYTYFGWSSYSAIAINLFAMLVSLTMARWLVCVDQLGIKASKLIGARL